MSANSAIVQRLEQRSQQAEQIIARLKSQLKDLKKSAGPSSGGDAVSQLQAENAKLQADVERALRKLVALEASHGTMQIPLPRTYTSQAGKGTPAPEVNSTEVQGSEGQGAAESATPTPQPAVKKAKKEKAEKAEKPAKPAPAADEPSVAQVDFRIGRIVEVQRHPDADSLYVEQIELGEATPRTVVTGLVKHVPIEEMRNRLVILCCNLKPAKMRGVLSQAMVMCAAANDKVEILIPPEGAVPGDRVSCQGYEVGDFPPQMNPKKKIFEKIKPHLRTDANKVACYKGAAFEVKGKGLCLAPSMVDAEIR